MPLIAACVCAHARPPRELFGDKNEEGASSPWQAREQVVAGAERWLTLVCSTGRAYMLSCCVPMRRLMLVECTRPHLNGTSLCKGDLSPVITHNSASHEALDLIVGVLSA